MKPANWNEMTQKEKLEYAMQLMRSMRGQYIVGQALKIASSLIHRADHPYKEISNAEDMEVLGEVLFGPFYGMVGADKVIDSVCKQATLAVLEMHSKYQ